MKLEEFTTTKQPVVLIYGLQSPLTLQLISQLLPQKAHVILTDFTTSKVKAILSSLPLEKENILYMEYPSLYKKLPALGKLDFVFHNLIPRIVGTNFPESRAAKHGINNQTFLQETQLIETLMRASVEFNAVYTLILPAYLTQLIEAPNELSLQLYEQAQLLFKTYTNSNSLNGRLVKMAEAIGNNFDLSAPTITANITKQLLTKSTITIPGDGLTTLSLMDSTEGARGLIYLSTQPKLKGKSIKLEYQESYSVINLVHTMAEILQKNIKIKTDPNHAGYLAVMEQKDQLMLLQDAPAAQKYGFTPFIGIEESLTRTLEFILRLKGKGLRRVGGPNQVPTISQVKESKTTKNKPKLQPLTKLWGTTTNIVKKIILSPITIIKHALELTPTDQTKLAQESLKIKPFIKFVFYILITTLLAFATAPVVYFFIRYYQLKNTVNQALKNPNYKPTTLITSLQDPLNDVNIVLPPQLYKIPVLESFLEEIQTTVSTANALVETLKWRINVTLPVSKYLETKDPQHIQPLLENAVNNPTYAAATLIHLNDLKTKLPHQYNLNQDISLLKSLSLIYPVLPQIMGYPTPVTWVISTSYNSTRTVVTTYLVNRAAVIPNPNNTTDTPYIEFFVTPKAIEKLANQLGVPTTQNTPTDVRSLISAFAAANTTQKLNTLQTLIEQIYAKNILVTSDIESVDAYFK